MSEGKSFIRFEGWLERREGRKGKEGKWRTKKKSTIEENDAFFLGERWRKRKTEMDK